MKRSQIVNIYKDTVIAGKRFGGRFDQSTLYEASEIPDWCDISTDPIKNEPGRGAPKYTPKVSVVNALTLTTARELYDDNNKLLVLVMASDSCPGGDVIKGTQAQEEDIYRCTNFTNCSNKSYYPLTADSFIITEKVTVFKDKDYQALLDPVQLDFISMPAVYKPGLRYGTYLSEEEAETMKLKIDLIFRYAVLEGYNILVLGALGCDVIGNPAEDVAHMFKNTIDLYGGYFKQIVFSVPSEEKYNTFNIFKDIIVHNEVRKVS